MTSPGTDAATLGAIVARTRYLLLDFDGPICSIYAGLPASTVAEKLRQLFPGELPDGIADTPDPIEVFRYSATVSDEMAARVEAEMADLEVAAVPTAEPTPYVHEVIASAHESGRIVGVVTNNSPRAVNAYLDRHSLSGGIRLVVARTSHNPALLKPSPHLIDKAVCGLDADPAATTLVGDSFSLTSRPHTAPAWPASATQTNQASYRA
jgi:phosphoglycolate phosphatase